MSTNVLLSIKPLFADRIFNGDKRYEYRKVLFRDRNIKKVIVYASAPISRVVGEFHVESVLRLEPEKLWHKTHQVAGISKEFFDSYFEGRDFGYAIEIGHVHRYHTPLALRQHFGLKQPPQSFAYVQSPHIHYHLSYVATLNNSLPTMGGPRPLHRMACRANCFLRQSL